MAELAVVQIAAIGAAVLGCTRIHRARVCPGHPDQSAAASFRLRRRDTISNLASPAVSSPSVPGSGVDVVPDATPTVQPRKFSNESVQVIERNLPVN